MAALAAAPSCLIAVIEQPEVIEKILTHLGLWTAPAHSPPLTGDPGKYCNCGQARSSSMARKDGRTLTKQVGLAEVKDDFSKYLRLVVGIFRQGNSEGEHEGDSAQQ